MPTPPTSPEVIELSPPPGSGPRAPWNEGVLWLGAAALIGGTTIYLLRRRGEAPGAQVRVLPAGPGIQMVGSFAGRLTGPSLPGYDRDS